MSGKVVCFVLILTLGELGALVSGLWFTTRDSGGQMQLMGGRAISGRGDGF